MPRILDEDANPPEKSPRSGRDAAKPRKVDDAWALRAASHYLERYASSAENLRRVLARKALKRLLVDRLEPEHGSIIAGAVAKMEELGFINDSQYAGQKTGSLRRRGASAMKITAALAAKGVGRDDISAAMGEDDTTELQAALTLARRRRIGPYRRPDMDAAEEADPAELRRQRDREIAILCRAGYPPGLARKVIDGEAGLE